MSASEPAGRRRTPRAKALGRKPELEGTIVGMERPNRMSSIGYLVLETSKDTEVKILCDIKYTNMALADCFGEVSVVGKRIWYRVDDVGVLAAIGPVDA